LAQVGSPFFPFGQDALSMDAHGELGVAGRLRQQLVVEHGCARQHPKPMQPLPCRGIRLLAIGGKQTANSLRRLIAALDELVRRRHSHD
jgi:hypothetical protein